MSETKTLTIRGKKVIIKKISVLDFADTSTVPFSMFGIKELRAEDQGMFGQIIKQKPSYQEQKKEVSKDLIRQILEKGITQSEMSIEDILAEELVYTFVYANIINFSCDNVKQPVLFNKNFALYIDAMAKRYAQQPAGIIGGEFNTLEKYMLNVCIFTAGISEEIAQNKKLMAKFKKRR
ncbi:hypothetical protein NO1_1284 [Candidatus Termititenax aidoneus]|uniref:Uncharacterized protein n=1 Tax=Termititenax aidoneus TaxID=2218524 RepID=A0A388TC59_TERA1|nr:hypothetical protein NO1_1284 [Candidatus Termititenax aidoneus]